MPSILDATGYTIQGTDEIRADYLDGYSYVGEEGTTITIAGLKEIYGADTDFSSDTQDGQALEIEVQAERDRQEGALALYLSRDPNNAVGFQQDSLYAINNIQRKLGTFTTTLIDITVDRALNLEGEAYTVADGAGDEFILVADATFSAAGTQSLSFQSKRIGKILTTPNSINTPITVVLGVTAVNNPLDATVVGTDAETDTQFRLRRTKSVANSSIRYTEALYGQLLDIPGVESVVILENTSANTDANLVPPHGIWVIINGGDNDLIGEVMYSNLGCNDMKGTVSVIINTVFGTTFPVYFDRSIAQDLYIQFNVRGASGLDITALQLYIATNLTYDIAENAYSSQAIEAAIAGLKDQASSGQPVDLLISTDDVTYSEYLPTTTPQYRFNPDISRIAIVVI